MKIDPLGLRHLLMMKGLTSVLVFETGRSR